jgi:serine/threonine protein kinase
MQETSASDPVRQGGDQASDIVPVAPAGVHLPVLPDGLHPVPLGSGTIATILGEGGAAIVYEIWVDKLGISRAVKVLKPNATLESVGRFETEMRITAQLHHPNIIEIHNVGDWHGLPYIEMEKIDGFSLDKIIRDRGGLPAQMATAIAMIVCKALHFTHNHGYMVNDKKHVGILHRDLKPSNIMISRAGIVKLMDFGIATPTDASLHTIEGTVVGSLQYLAPELLEGSQRANPRSDIFSLGCVLYEMITGERTFPEKNMAKLVAMRLKNTIRPLSDYTIKCPRHLVRLINCCLARDPDKRYAEVADVLGDLEKIHRRLTRYSPEQLVEFFVNSSLKKSSVIYKHKFPVASVAASAALVAMVAAGLYAGLTLSRHRPVPAPAAPVPPAASAPPSADLVPPQPKHPAPERPEAEVQSSKVEQLLSRGSREKDPVAALEKRYRTADHMVILAGEVDKGNFSSALKVYESLDREAAASRKSILYKLRALQGIGDAGRLADFFAHTDIPDKEFYCAKAQYMSSVKRHGEAIGLCEKSAALPASLGNTDELNRIAAYVKAASFTSLYLSAPGDDMRKKALDSWFEVKYLLRNNQTHPYFELANKNIRLLTDQAKGAKL